MSKKITKSGGLTSITGGRGGDGSDGSDSQGNPTSSGAGKVVDFSTVRAKRNLDNRRTVERFFLQRMVDVYAELNGGQLPLEVVEVSETGCSFRLAAEKVKTLPRDGKGELLPLYARFYFSSDSYLRVGLNVINATSDIAGAGGSAATRFGCQVDPSFASTEAYTQFVRFIEMFAKHCSRDSKQATSY